MTMIRHQHRMVVWIAALAIIAALVLLLIPHADSSHVSNWLAILPIFFIGLVSPLALLGTLKFSGNWIIPDAPPLSATFERPPPSHRG